MGQGGYITIHNDTDYDMEKVKGGAYQMAFDSPRPSRRISPASSMLSGGKVA